MRITTCPREPEVVRAALRKRWPHGCDDDLRRHAETCGCCSEVAALAVVLSEQADDHVRLARVPAAGQVWWRAAVRAHAEATRTAVRPMVWLQGVAAACAVGVGAALVDLSWPALHDLIGRAGARAASASSPTVLLMAAVAAFVVFAPIALYVVLSDGD